MCVRARARVCVCVYMCVRVRACVISSEVMRGHLKTFMNICPEGYYAHVDRCCQQSDIISREMEKISAPEHQHMTDENFISYTVTVSVRGWIMGRDDGGSNFTVKLLTSHDAMLLPLTSESDFKA